MAQPIVGQDSLVGQELGHYRLLEKIGEGGMGVVYRARDAHLSRDVAIKVLPAGMLADSAARQRFRKEALALSGLNHPNIATIYGVEDRAIVMELVEGADLKGPLSAEEALPIIEQLIDALEYAQEVVSLGAGEILLTSMDRDGTRQGFDLPLTRAIADSVPVPVIASGGVGNLDHLVEGIREGHATAVLAASIFHFGEFTIREAKDHMARAGLPMRLDP